MNNIQSQGIILPFHMQQEEVDQHKMGLLKCFHSFQSVYCYRKLTEFILSSIFMVTCLILLIAYIKKYWVTRPYWLSSLLIVMILAFISNIIFCFFNSYFWIYALEVYFKNMYFLILVSYICYNYLLRHTPQEKQDLMEQLNINLAARQNKQISNQRIIFYLVVAILVGGYLGILITSIVYQIQHQNEELKADGSSNGTGDIKYCQQTWYLILHVVCIVLSIIVVVVMLKSQRDEYKKLIAFERQRSQNSATTIDIRFPSSNSSQAVYGSFRGQSYEERNDNFDQKVKNPFKNLWIWVGINIFCQVINLIQSGFQLSLVPPMCYIVPDNKDQSNAIALIFVLITFYLGFGVTIWYILFVKTLSNRTGVDRSDLYSQEINLDNSAPLILELPPSRQLSITLSLPSDL